MFKNIYFVWNKSKCTFKFLEVILMSCAKHFLNFKRRMKINAKNWRKLIKNLGWVIVWQYNLAISFLLWLICYWLDLMTWILIEFNSQYSRLWLFLMETVTFWSEKNMIVLTVRIFFLSYFRVLQSIRPSLLKKIKSIKCLKFPDQ